MVNFRGRQRVNRRATVALLVTMFACVAAAGIPMIALVGDPSLGLLLGLCLVAAIFPLLSYWFSDAAVIHTTGAHVLSYQDAPELHNIVDEDRIAAGLPMPRIAVIQDDSPNALATGRNPDHAVIALTTGLLDSMTRDELQGVVAHEVGHIANRDILVMSVAASIAAVLWAMHSLIAAFATRRNEDGNVQDGGPLAMLLLVFTPILVTCLNAGMSRRRESLADATAVQFTRNPSGLRHALERLQWFDQSPDNGNAATAHLWFNARTSWRGRLLATHPPLEDRIARLREMEGANEGDRQ
ncbi:MAG: M48 family metallopeptidase [Candidatus Nanopelagicales bacterium]